nr:FixH family protein [Desulfobulbaceae bacterium]
DVDNAYEKGMQYPVELEKIAKLGWNFSVKNNLVVAGAPGTVELLIVDNEGIPVQGAQVSMEFSLLTKPDGLPSQSAPEKSPGQYLATVDLPVHGHWLVDVKIIYNGETLLHTFKLYIEKGK